MVEVSISGEWTQNAEAGPSRLAESHPRNININRKTKKSRKGSILQWTALLVAASAVSGTEASSTPGPRWGQASALSGNHWVVHGGKSNGDVGGGGYTFTSGVNSGELLLLDLSQSFSTSSPPWNSINTSTSVTNSPTVAFHSLLPLNQASQLMIFGGDVSNNAATLTGNDSAYMLDMSSYQSASWSPVNTNWDQPERRIYQSAASDGKGSVWIVGGERDDGSYIEMDEMWLLNTTTSSPAFEQQATPIGGLIGSTATMLSDGSLLVLGGQNSTGLQSFSEITTYSTTNKRWLTTATKGVNNTEQGIPSPRLSHVAVSLPNKKVLIHGGATAGWSQAMGDAWILDWSQDPPTWSDITASGVNVPSARFGHSAVARGDVAVFSFGWASNNPADAAVYVFDANTLTSTSAGVWSGGSWTSTYTPDLSLSSSSSSSSSGTGGTASGSGSASGSTSGSSKPGYSTGKGSSSSKDPFSNPTNNGDNPGQSTQYKPTSSTGAKAGAAMGALLGVGLIAGAGYLVYRKKRPDGEDDDDFDHRGAGAGLLRGSNHYYGADDDPRMMEKGIEYTGVGIGGIASFQAGIKPIGPRTAAQRNSEMIASPWSMANIGHAMEGSGPHLRERLALMTGIGFGGAAAGRQQRFDMLADEDDERLEETDQGMLGSHEDDEIDDERYNGVARRIRERSYGRVDQFDNEDHQGEHSYGDLAGIGAGYHGEDFVTSPFEDGAMISLATRETDDESVSFVHTIDTEEVSDNTSQSRNHSNSSNAAQYSHSPISNATGIMSFSDSSHQKVKRSNSQASSLMRRSPTWWDRFKGQSFLERSASGQLLPGPRAEEPIRDPAIPPALSAIREASSRSNNPSQENPFAEQPYSTTDEMGRYYEPYTEEQHSRSMSSVQSGKTMTSSIMETRFQNMDVVQRARTTSSRRTYSSGQDGSIGSSIGLGQENNQRSSAGHHQMVASPSESTPGLVIFDGSQWSTMSPLPGTIEEGDDTIQGQGDTSMDIVDLGKTTGPKKRSKTSDALLYKSHDSSVKRSRTTAALHGRTAKIREASDAPSLTPSTTKRARQNRKLTAPVSPAPDRKMVSPVRGSVLDRVKAIERKRVNEGEALLPIPRSPLVSDSSPGAGPHIFIPGRGGQPILTRLAIDYDGGNDSELVNSPLAITSPVSSSKDKFRYTHGLVQKPQLFVANPDGRGSADS